MKYRLVEQLWNGRPKFEYDRLNPAQAEAFLLDVLGVLFPHWATCPSTQEAVLALATRAEANLLDLLAAVGQDASQANSCAMDFFEKLGDIAPPLKADAQFMYECDPAAESLDEVILAYPGFLAVAAYRISRILYLLKVPVVPRLVSEQAHRLTGIDIHPAAEIDSPFCIDHGTGVVIGETAQIGKGVILYQGVTLGALSVSKELSHMKRHPTVEDDVVIYAGATILGGNTAVGAGSVIGGSVWLTRSVPPKSVVYHRPEIHFREELDGAPATGFGA